MSSRDLKPRHRRVKGMLIESATPSHHFRMTDVALIGGCCDVEEYQFVGAFLRITKSALDGISCVAESDEVDSFDDPSFLDVEAWDDAFG